MEGLLPGERQWVRSASTSLQRLCLSLSCRPGPSTWGAVAGVCGQVGPRSRRLCLLMGFWQRCRASSQARFTGEAEPRRGAGACCRRETLWGHGNRDRHVPGGPAGSKGSCARPGGEEGCWEPPASHSPTRGPAREAGPRLRGAARTWPGPEAAGQGTLRECRQGRPAAQHPRAQAAAPGALLTCSRFPSAVQVAHRLLLWPLLTQKHPAEGIWGDVFLPC